MRLWSIHPQYLDSKGLVALWRETLLAKKVLQNKTKGYKQHPQLERFKKQSSPVACLNRYLQEIFIESKKRNFKFNSKKIGPARKCRNIKVASRQIEYEFNHLLQKLKERDPSRYNQYKDVKEIKTNPVFHKVSGPVANWEKVY